MTDSPSPYAPGIIGDEPVAPRPAGRPAFFLVGTFVVILGASGTLFSAWAQVGVAVGRRPLGILRTGLSAAHVLTLLWAYLSDRVPLWGSRRQGYVLFAALLQPLAWLTAALSGERFAIWLLGAVLLGFVSAVARVATMGAFAEIGQSSAATGRLAAAYIGITQLAAIATWIGGIPLARGSLWLTTGVVGGLSLAVILLFTMLPESSDVPPVPAAAPRPSIPRFLGSRAFWSSFLVCALAGAATVPRELKDNRNVVTVVGLDWTVDSLIPATVILVSLVYFACCRRIRFGVLLRATLAIKACALITHPMVERASDGWPSALAFLARAGANGLLSVALLDLALRVAPRGREAFGAMLLAGITTIAFTISNTVEEMLQLQVEAVAWFAAGAAIAAALAASLLPKEATARPDGEP